MKLRTFSGGGHPPAMVEKNTRVSPSIRRVSGRAMRPFTNKTICGPASPVRTTRCRSASSRSLCPTVRPKEWSAGSTRCCQTTTAAAVGTNTAAPPRKSYGSWDCRTSSERSTGKEGNAHVEDGIQAIPRGHLFGLIDLNPNLSLYYFVLFIFLFGLFIIQRITHSPFGRVLVAVCENEPRAISLGYKTHRYKLLAFVLSAGLSSLAGAMKVLGVSAGFADRRALARLQGCGTDDPAGRSGNGSGSGGGGFPIGGYSRLFRAGGSVGNQYPGHYFRGVRDDIAPGHRWKVARVVAAPEPLKTGCRC